MFSFLQDLRYALRILLKSPGFTIVAVLTLALGIGANVATFSVVYGVLLRPLPFPQPEQLVRVFDDLRGPGEQDVGMSAPELWDLQDSSGVFQEISAVAPTNSAIGGGERTVRAESLVTSPDYFTLLGAKPQLGRIYTKQDAVPGFLEPVVISDGFWRRNYGSDPNIIGRKMSLDTDIYTIVGVMPPGFRHPGRTLNTDVEVWVRHRILRCAVSSSCRSVAANRSRRDRTAEARPHRRASASSPRRVHARNSAVAIRKTIPPRPVGRFGSFP